MLMFGVEDTAISLALLSKASLDGYLDRCSMMLSCHSTTGPLKPGENGSPGMSSLGLLSGERIGDELALALQVQGVLQRADAWKVDEFEKILDGPFEGYGRVRISIRNVFRFGIRI